MLRSVKVLTVALLAFKHRSRAAALLLGIVPLLLAAPARARQSDSTVISNTEGLSVATSPSPKAAHRLRDPPVRANARRLRAPARAQAQPSTARAVRFPLCSGGAGILQPDQHVYLTRGGTLWSWPGNNPFRWRDPSRRFGYEDFEFWMMAHGNDLAVGVAATSLAPLTIYALVSIAPAAAGGGAEVAAMAKALNGLGGAVGLFAGASVRLMQRRPGTGWPLEGRSGWR